MYYIRFFSVVLIILLGILQSCQPVASRRGQETGTQPDSALYYQQADIADPFLDTIFQEPDRAVALNTTLYPPPPVEPVPAKFKNVDGFRVQILAGADSIQVLNNSRELAAQFADSVYFFQDKGLFKVQIGDYQFRYKADSVKTIMRRDGFPGAWVVQTTIHIPIDTTGQADNNIEPAAPAIPPAEGKYKIQIAATGSKDKAQEIVAQIREISKYGVSFEQSGTLYKVFVGSFPTEAEARQELNVLRSNGYPDAWLVY